MLKHIVCYKLKDGGEVKRELVRGLLLSMRSQIDEIRDIFVGVDVLGSDRSYDVLLEVTLDDLDALSRYKEHPYHADLIKPYMHDAFEKSVSVDCEY